MSYELISLRFVGKTPTTDELVRLNNSCRNVDYSFPQLHKSGFDCEIWAKPRVTLDQMMLLLHHAGFVCEGWQVAFLERSKYDQEHPYKRPDPDTTVDKDNYEYFMSEFKRDFNGT